MWETGFAYWMQRHAYIALAIGIALVCGCAADSPADGSQADTSDAEAVSCADHSDCVAPNVCIEQKCTPHPDENSFDPAEYGVAPGEGGGTKVPFGDSVGEFMGVVARSNYDASGPHDTVFPDGTSKGTNQYGLTWQCVEYVVRFFVEVHGYANMNGSGNAVFYWNEAPYSSKTTAAKNLERHANGGSNPPAPGDAMVFSNGGNVGHIAIVRSVTEDQVCLIHQNWSHTASDGNTCIDMNSQGGNYQVVNLSGSYTTLGWARPAGSTPDCTVESQCPDDHECIDNKCVPAACADDLSTGSFTTPADGATVSTAFTVKADVADANGITHCTVTVDTDDDCKFKDVSFNGSLSGECVVSVDLEQAGCSAAGGVRSLGLWVLDGCGIATSVDSRTVIVEACECTVGDATCEGDAVKICKADCSGWQYSVCDHGCDPVAAECNDPQCVCTPNDTQCDGSGNSQTCSSDCMGWDTSVCPESACGACESASCADGICGCAVDSGCCGNGLCESGETPANCSADCAGCGDGSCGADETKCSCAADCGGCSGCCDGTECSAGTSASQCGDNGASCDSCSGDELCTAGSCVVPDPGCYIARVHPGAQSTFTSCETSAEHALYKAKSADPVGNYADITFTKCPDGGGPSANVGYWVVTGPDVPDEPSLCMPFNQSAASCDSLSCCRESGTWSQDDNELTVNTRLWPDESWITLANNGETKSIYIETGGGTPGDANKPIWHSAESAKFQIVCE